MSAIDTVFDPGPLGADVHFVTAASAPSVDLRTGTGLAAPARLHRASKRALDIVVALVLLLLVLPVLVIGAIGVKLSSPGPVLFRQTRVGRDGRRFEIMKLRSFPIDNVPPSVEEHDGSMIVPTQTSPLRWGNLLRQTSVDELPQLFNVLKGDMALVGPRPERPELVEALAEVVPGYDQRHLVPVGITGHAQVKGLSGSTPIEERVRADHAYIDGWHLGRDVLILLRTIPTLWRKSQVC